MQAAQAAAQALCPGPLRADKRRPVMGANALPNNSGCCIRIESGVFKLRPEILRSFVR